MNKSRWLTTGLIFFVVLSACSAQPTPTSTLIPSVTPRPTATVAPIHLSLGERLNIGDVFSFQIIETYPYEIDGPAIYMGNPAVDMEVTFYYLDFETNGPLAARAFFSRVADYFTSYETEEQFVRELGNLEYLFMPLRGTAEGSNFEGVYAEYTLRDNSQFFALGLGRVSADRNAWIEEGLAAFEAMLETVEFGASGEVGMACAVSADPEYGYTEENPVRVGGATYGEPLLNNEIEREFAYLNNLLGLAGEAVTYERVGSVPMDNAILDVYSLTSSGFSEARTLYIDIYSYEIFFAPVGFTCAGRFTISAP